MKKFLFAFLALVLLLAGATLFYFSKTKSSDQMPISPLPSFLSLFENSEVSTIDLWKPDVNTRNLSKAPEISAVSALVFDMSTNKTLYSKDPFKKLPMASLTKIMTAVLALENPKADNKYLVTQADLVGEDSMGLTAGETLSMNELLYGLMLDSGNDAAETLASNYKEGRDQFVIAMNKKTKALGLSDTHFTNPTGLEGDGNQYTTAQDLLVITRYALNFDMLRTVVSTFDYDIAATSTHKEFWLENETNLLTSYPGVKGVKTGYTPEAGLCLVTYLDYNGHKVIGIILGSDNRRQEMKDLLDFSLRSEGINPPPHG